MSEVVINNVCGDILNIDHDASEVVKNGFSCVIGLSSIIGLTIVFMTIFLSERLKEHPSPLIARICVAEAIMCWFTMIKVVGFPFVICFLNVHEQTSSTLKIIGVE